MGRILGQTFPDDLFVVRENGRVRFYDSDPMKIENRETEAIDLGEYLMDFYGEADAVNPLMIHIAGVINRRGQTFDITIPGKIASGLLPKHIEDTSGHPVNILESRSGDPLFPLIGVLLDEKGNEMEKRKYSGNGECSDGDSNHRLVVMNGVLKFAQRNSDGVTENI